MKNTEQKVEITTFDFYGNAIYFTLTKGHNVTIEQLKGFIQEGLDNLNSKK